MISVIRFIFFTLIKPVRKESFQISSYFKKTSKTTGKVLDRLGLL